MRRPLNSTRVRSAPRPRRLMLPEPVVWPAPNWLDSPMAPLTAGIDLIRSTVEGAPCFCISSAPMTFTGRAESSGEPAMKEPVTTTSATSASASGAF